MIQNPHFLFDAKHLYLPVICAKHVSITEKWKVYKNKYVICAKKNIYDNRAVIHTTERRLKRLKER